MAKINMFICFKILFFCAFFSFLSFLSGCESIYSEEYRESDILLFNQRDVIYFNYYGIFKLKGYKYSNHYNSMNFDGPFITVRFCFHHC
ncbi:hypothetical protein AFI02nite_40030 [Aliivibrio fischeri]|uniref:Lipoprotein n=1 Tax=Aliivibrio fischeri TaxID=668 RepID=A0A510UMV0_ALIFS|nr:hypothetical protein AFI02nite_40030 [Aliivibrio fischeri]